MNRANETRVNDPVRPATGYARLRGAIDLLDAGLMALGGLMMLLLMLLVVSDVTLRYLFNTPLAWSYEVVSTYLMPGLFFLAVSHTLRSHGHVAVDILHNRMSRRTRYFSHAVTSALAMPAFGLCAVVAAQRTWVEFQAGDISMSGIGVPSWTASVLLPLGFGLLTLRLALDAVGYCATLVSGREVLALPPVSGSEELAP
jgi:TRAP-type C4-dicarboxylate transport system permease small subunit